MRRPLAAAVLIFTGLIRLITWFLPLPVPESQYEDGQTVVCEGVVEDIVSAADFVLIYLKHSDSCISDSETVSVDRSDKESNNKKIICKVKKNETLPEMGSKVRYQGTVSCFQSASNPGEFDSCAHYGRQGYAFQLKNAVLLGKSREYDRVRQGIFLLKCRLGETLELFFGEQDVSVIRAMLLGEKKGLDQEVKSLYQQAGISHVLAISGLHVSMLGMGVYHFLSRFCSRRISCLMSGMTLVFFLMMTGFSASSLRAGVMFLLGMTARIIGRTYDAPTALAVAAVLLLAENPAWLADSGFLLSFLAALGAIVVLPVFAGMEDWKEWRLHRRKGGGGAGKLYREKEQPQSRGIGRLRREMWNGFLSGFCISMVTLPVILYTFYEWNVLSILVNLAVIPLMGVLLGCCIFLAAAGTLFTAFLPQLLPFLLPLSLPVKSILYFYEKVCLLETSLPFGMLRTGRPQIWQILLFYLGFGVVLLLAKRIPRAAGICMVTVLGSVFLIRPSGEVQMTMLDVGQGECIYIETETGKDYLYDGGSSSKSDTGTWQIMPFLKYEGVKRLELIFISHCDADHISGILEILNQAETGAIQIGGIVLAAEGPDDEMRRQLVKSAAMAEVPVYQMRAGECIGEDECEFLALYPDSGVGMGTDRNNSSLVIRFSRKRNGEEVFAAMLTGDVEKTGEMKILSGHTKAESTADIAGNLLHVDILDVAHHGSGTSSCGEFLDAVSPRLALISCGENNSYGHPHEEVLQRLAERGIPVLITAQSGAVTIRQRGQKITAETFSDVDSGKRLCHDKK